MQLNTLEDVFHEQLEDLYSAEKQLVSALPQMASAVGSEELRKALQNHLEETRGHVTRLEEIFGQLGMSTPTAHCKGMEGLIAEGKEIVQMPGNSVAKDAAIIAAAQRVEHYEIAGYGTARTLAGELDQSEARDLLDQTLDEESDADKLLTKIATGGLLKTGINEKAAAR
jgi:ferritin-like metal-binding protein YciE